MRRLTLSLDASSQRGAPTRATALYAPFARKATAAPIVRNNAWELPLGARRRPHVVGVAGEDRTLGVEEGKLLVEPRRQPPGAIAGELHDRRQQPEADDCRVDQDRGREADAELLDQGEAREGEGDEDGDHDRRGAGDDPRGLRD